MTSHNRASTFPTWLVVITIMALVWHAWGMIDLARTARFGYGLDADQIVTLVTPDSPAARGGLQVGDQLLALDGVAIDDPAFARRPRLAIGDAVRFHVAREGQTHQSVVVAGPLPWSNRVTAIINTAIGLAFLGAGCIVRRRHPQALATRFAALAMAAAFLFAWTPYLGTGLAGRALGWALNVLVLIACGLFVDLVLDLPQARPRGRAVRIALFLPALLATGLAVGALFIAGGTGGPFALLAGYLNQWAPRVFLVLGLGILVVRFARSAPAQRRASGLGLLLVGTVASVVPFVVVGMVGPRLGWPPGTASLSLLILPVVLAIAVSRSVGRTTG